MTSVIRVLPTGHTTALEWLWLIVPIVVLVSVVAWLIRTGDPGPNRGIAGMFASSASSLRRLSGLPAWASGGLALCAWTLVVAVIGFIWDVAWHIDFGRDRQLFTSAHTMILTGLLGIGAAGIASIGLATVERAPVWRTIGRLHVPASAVALLVLSGGAALGFPLDDLWHRAYGIDVTMWGPTHLLMIGGASFTPVAMWLMYAEGGGPRVARAGRIDFRPVLAVALALGLSTFQLEFDLGVPQWQMLYHPVLIALATSITFVCARVALGRGWALRAAVLFLVMRGLLALVVGHAMGHTVPHFPIYLGAALAVELGFALNRNGSMLARGLLAGALAGTVGLASEWGWTHLFGREPWHASLFSGIWIAVLVAVAGGVLGLAFGRVVSLQHPAIPKSALLIAGAVVLAGLVAPFARHPQESVATIKSSAAGPGTTVLSQDGVASTERLVNVTVAMQPVDAARDSDWFVIQSWQGGHLKSSPLVRIGPGTYRAEQPVPTGGSWKSIVMLFKRDTVAAAPIWIPRDPQYNLPVISVKAVRVAPMARASKLLTRESHGGAAWPAVIAYGGLGLTALTWLAVVLLVATSIARRSAERPVGSDVAHARVA
jgi:hypothetical protein